MEEKEFIKWFDGFTEGLGDSEISQEQWKSVLECFNSIRYLIATDIPPITNPCSPFNVPYNPTPNPYIGGITLPSHFDKCFCNPKNGGSGICGCTLNGNISFTSSK